MNSWKSLLLWQYISEDINVHNHNAIIMGDTLQALGDYEWLY